MHQLMFRAFWPLWICLFSFASGHTAHGAVVNDGSAGKGKISKGKGKVFRIKSSVGKQSGKNLFLSFKKFDLRAKESALILAGKGTKTVIVRVTGKQQSKIGGKIRVSGGADLVLVNNRGWSFKGDAKLSTEGNIAIGSADYVGFRDGVRFPAQITAAEEFPKSRPVNLGFATNSSAKLNLTGISIRPKQILTLAGQSVRLSASRIVVPTSGLLVSGAAQDVEVPLRHPTKGKNSASGSVILSNKSTLRSGDEIAINGDHVQIEDSVVDVKNESAETGNLILSAGSLRIQNGRVSASGTIAGSNIAIEGKSLNLGASSIRVRNSAPENPGEIDVVLSGRLRMVNSKILSLSDGSGRMGDIKVSAHESVTLSDGAAIDLISKSDGNGGSLSVESVGAILISGPGSRVTSRSEAAGDGSVIQMEARGSIAVTSGGTIQSISQEGGDGGGITLRSAKIRISGGAISSIARGTGDGGALSLFADDSLGLTSGRLSSNTLASGRAGDLTTRSSTLTMRGDGSTGISVNTSGSGRAGDLVVTALGKITLLAGEISASNSNLGQAGFVSIRSHELLIQDDATAIVSKTRSAQRGASIRLRTEGATRLFDGGSISTIAFEDGPAGSLSVFADTLKIDGFFSGLGSDTRSAGRSGDVTVDAKEISILNGGGILIGSSGAGDSGNLRIRCEDLEARGDSTGIVLRATGQGDTGNMSVKSENSISLSDGAGVQSLAVRSNAGQISIHADGALELNRGFVSSLAKNDSGALKLGAGDSLSAFRSSIKARSVEGSQRGLELDPSVLILNLSTVSTASVNHTGNLKISSPIALFSGSSLPAAGDLKISSSFYPFAASAIPMTDDVSTLFLNPCWKNANWATAFFSE